MCAFVIEKAAKSTQPMQKEVLICCTEINTAIRAQNYDMLYATVEKLLDLQIPDGEHEFECHEATVGNFWLECLYPKYPQFETAFEYLQDLET
jgi:hypothetical protein